MKKLWPYLVSLIFLTAVSFSSAGDAKRSRRVCGSSQLPLPRRRKSR